MSLVVDFSGLWAAQVGPKLAHLLFLVSLLIGMLVGFELFGLYSTGYRLEFARI